VEARTEVRAESDTRRRIIDATIEAIRTKGTEGATARAIGAIGGFNQALIYYYFGSLNGLLVAALEATSDKRMARYLAEMDRIGSLEDLGRVGTELFREDADAGTVTVISELVSSSLTHPEMRAEVMAQLEPWVALIERLISRLTKGSAVESLLPARDVAWALVALYMGMEMLHHLDGDASRAQRLFEMFSRVAPLADSFVGTKATQ
jgi:AcrR family transcriptional regulator